MRLLVADDDEALRTYLGCILESDGHLVRLVADGQAALDAFREEAPDMVILDLNMPRLDGVEVLRILRAADDDLLIMALTARSELETRLECLDSGADDFLSKPFALAELRAHVRALARRRRETRTVLRCGSFVVNRMEHTVSCGGEMATLTSKEFALLDYLLLNHGRAVSRTVLLDKVWKMPPESKTNIVDVYVNYLRHKLNSLTGEPLVETVRGAGYAIRMPVAAGDSRRASPLCGE